MVDDLGLEFLTKRVVCGAVPLEEGFVQYSTVQYSSTVLPAKYCNLLTFARMRPACCGGWFLPSLQELVTNQEVSLSQVDDTGLSVVATFSSSSEDGSMTTWLVRGMVSTTVVPAKLEHVFSKYVIRFFPMR